MRGLPPKPIPAPHHPARGIVGFAKQRSASTKTAEEWAKQVGLTDQQIKDCKADTSIMDKIRDDIDSFFSIIVT